VPAKLRSEEFAGGATVKVSSKRAGLVELRVTEGEGSTPLASVQARILPNRLDRFVVNAPREVTAGEAFQARIIAQDAYGNTKDDLADIREGLRVEIQGTGSAASADKAPPPSAAEATFTQSRKAARSASPSGDAHAQPAPRRQSSARSIISVLGPKARGGDYRPDLPTARSRIR
jgi:hypothetical protein